MKGTLEQYKKGASILELARAVNYPPHLFARYVVEAVTSLGRKQLAEAMRDGTALKSAEVIVDEFVPSEQVRQPPPEPGTTRLATEVKQAQDADPLHGPRSDKERHVIGIEYEVVLEHYLSEMGEFFHEFFFWGLFSPVLWALRRVRDGASYHIPKRSLTRFASYAAAKRRFF